MIDDKIVLARTKSADDVGTACAPGLLQEDLGTEIHLVDGNLCQSSTSLLPGLFSLTTIHRIPNPRWIGRSRLKDLTRTLPPDNRFFLINQNGLFHLGM